MFDGISGSFNDLDKNEKGALACFLDAYADYMVQAAAFNRRLIFALQGSTPEDTQAVSDLSVVVARHRAIVARSIEALWKAVSLEKLQPVLPIVIAATLQCIDTG